jgi:hypothetical protein
MVSNYCGMVTFLGKTIYMSTSKSFLMDGYLISPLFPGEAYGLSWVSRGECV